MPEARAGSPQPRLSTSGCFTDPETDGCIIPGSVTTMAGRQVSISLEGTSARYPVGMVGIVEVVPQQPSTWMRSVTSAGPFLDIATHVMKAERADTHWEDPSGGCASRALFKRVGPVRFKPDSPWEYSAFQS